MYKECLQLRNDTSNSLSLIWYTHSHIWLILWCDWIWYLSSLHLGWIAMNSLMSFHQWNRRSGVKCNLCSCIAFCHFCMMEAAKALFDNTIWKLNSQIIILQNAVYIYLLDKNCLLFFLKKRSYHNLCDYAFFLYMNFFWIWNFCAFVRLPTQRTGLFLVSIGYSECSTN